MLLCINIDAFGNEIQMITDYDTQIHNVTEYSVILQALVTHEEGILVAL